MLLQVLGQCLTDTNNTPVAAAYAVQQAGTGIVGVSIVSAHHVGSDYVLSWTNCRSRELATRATGFLPDSSTEFRPIGTYRWTATPSSTGLFGGSLNRIFDGTLTHTPGIQRQAAKRIASSILGGERDTLRVRTKTEAVESPVTVLKRRLSDRHIVRRYDANANVSAPACEVGWRKEGGLTYVFVTPDDNQNPTFASAARSASVAQDEDNLRQAFNELDAETNLDSNDNISVTNGTLWRWRP